MLLKKLTLTNFRPFKGRHEMIFSTDKEKNITLVMAENGAGKTTLAQAFQWVLYSKTDGFKNKSLLNSVVEKEMPINSQEDVIAELELEHNDIDYTIIRKQVYRKDMNGDLKSDNPTVEIYTKNKNGVTEINNPIKSISTISNILPESLSKYFFFDGERIEKMAGEITSGKSEEFKDAVQNILGLKALTKAIEHLNPQSKNSVIGKYIAQMDASGGHEIQELRNTIYDSEEKIEKNKNRIESINDEMEYYSSEIEKTKNEISQYAEVEKMQNELNRLNAELDNEKKYKAKTISTLMGNFSKNTHNYFLRKPIKDALFELKDTGNIDKGIPYIRSETIKYLLERKKCICGADLSDPSSDAVLNLNELFKYIPPRSLGSSISQFKTQSINRIKSSELYFDNIEGQIGAIRISSNKIEELEHEIGEIDKNILNSSNVKVTDLKIRQTDMEKTLNDLRNELTNLTANNINLDEKKKEAESEISRLQMKVEKNNLLDQELKYAKAAYNIFKETYDFQENQTRDDLEDQINSLFKQIYAGGMTISIDEKYRIKTYVNELEENSSNIDSNTAKSYSIIFAFIVGVINLAKKKVNDKSDNSTIITDEYPLVMDAPLSSFDQKRIKNICSVIPNIARQVIIFIKDSDGNIAKKEMNEKIGIEYEVSLKDKDFPVDSKITKVGEY